MKKIVNTILGIVIAGVCSANLFAAADGDDGPEKNQSGRYLSVAYVQATTKEVPDPTLMTNIFTPTAISTRLWPGSRCPTWTISSRLWL